MSNILLKLYATSLVERFLETNLKSMIGFQISNDILPFFNKKSQFGPVFYHNHIIQKVSNILNTSLKKGNVRKEFFFHLQNV